MLKVFQRACVRAGIKVRYSQGFNPRPRLSLPLPRSVGIETEDDLLCVRVETSPQCSDIEQLSSTLSRQLPAGCELLGIRAADAKTAFQPCAATYLFTVRPQHLNDQLKAGIERLLASQSLNLQRRTDPAGRTRNVDVRPFLKTIEFDDKNIAVQCRISSAGSIRVEEILRLLELDTAGLAAPIRRTKTQWQSN
jgi:radical SAM-linked protein